MALVYVFHASFLLSLPWLHDVGLDCNGNSGDGCGNYLEAVYAQGGGSYFDAVPVHPYGTPLNWGESCGAAMPSIVYRTHDVASESGRWLVCIDY